eukprot:s359_g3.t2
MSGSSAIFRGKQCQSGAMTEQMELSDLTREQLEEIIRRSQRRESLSGQKDVVKATAAVVRKASEKLQAEISEASQRAAKVKSMDVCFLLDCTESMDQQIKAAKEKIVEIQRRIISCLGHGGNIRFSVVGYRDYDDSKQFEILPFSGDVKEVESFLSKLRAKGGADICEDVIGALSKALQLDWQATTRIIYLVCDAPPHGYRFKCGSEDIRNYDFHPYDHQQWNETDDLMAKSVKLNLNLVLLDYACDVHESPLLDRTFDVFSALRKATSTAKLQTLVLRPHNSTDDFLKCILASTKETLSMTLTQPISAQSRARTGFAQGDLSLYVKANVSWKCWKNWPLQKVLVTSVNVIALTSDTNPTRVIQSFRIRDEPFASGNMRYAFPATSLDGNLRFVLKVHKEASQNVSSMTLADVKTQAYAKLFAEEFSQRFPQAPLQFVDAWAIELPMWNIAKHATLEPFVDGVFEKYTSNNGFISSEAELAEAFCHFSWCQSGGQMMVTDLQGFGSAVFTDPQIHCVKPDFFSRGNLGKYGMDQFFLGHCCNDICHHLQLKKSPIQMGIASETVSIVSDKSDGLSSRFSSHGPLVCEYCSSFVPLRDQGYIDLIGEYQAVMCPACKKKVKKSMASTSCLSCNQPFKYSMYAIGMKASSVPPMCRSCEQGEARANSSYSIDPEMVEEDGNTVAGPLESPRLNFGLPLVRLQVGEAVQVAAARAVEEECGLTAQDPDFGGCDGLHFFVGTQCPLLLARQHGPPRTQVF